MAAATQPVSALLSAEEYLGTSFRPDCDFVDGHLEERNVGGTKHGLLQMQLAIWFFQHSEWNLRTIGEQRTRVNESRYRVPDVSVVPADGSLLEEPRVTPPLIAIEILSPDDRMNRVVIRLNDYVAMGVKNIWLFDPNERVAYTYSASGLKLIQEARLTIPDSPIFLDLPQLFAALD